MADTVDLNSIQEFRDEPAVFEEKAKEVAGIIHKAKHCILFTGAGISTAAKIPDFRGPNGVWTRQAQGREAPDCISMVAAQPTLTHNVMKNLVDDGSVKYIVSQNVDGLHLRSGIPQSKISELHGNTFLEVCWKCSEQYLHDYEVPNMSRGSACAECRQRVPHHCHCSGTRCTKCGAMLKDSIIHFGEGLPQKELELAFEHAALADVCIVAGSSLRVAPASEIPRIVARKKGGTLIIVNLQKTPFDSMCGVRAWGMMDEFFDIVQRELQVLRGGPSAASAQASSSVHSVRIVQTAERQPREGEDDWWKWSITVEPAEHVEWVTYKLHPSFMDSTITASRPPFEISRVGWGVFEVQLEIKVTDRKNTVKTTHMLDFSQPTTTTAVKL